jgi:hypothetical protein
VCAGAYARHACLRLVLYAYGVCTVVGPVYSGGPPEQATLRLRCARHEGGRYGTAAAL